MRHSENDEALSYNAELQYCHPSFLGNRMSTLYIWNN